jgi:hypothetical protein
MKVRSRMLLILMRCSPAHHQKSFSELNDIGNETQLRRNLAIVRSRALCFNEANLTNG